MKHAEKISAVLKVIGVILLLPVLAGAAEKSGQKSIFSPLKGSFDVEYRYRSDGHIKDQDMIERLSLEYFRPWARLGGDTQVGFVFLGRLQQDLDSALTRRQYDPFREVADSYKNSDAGWLYLAYAELKRSDSILADVRIGRMDMLDIEPVAFDGGLVTIRPLKKLYITAYGGVPTDLFQSDRDGDSAIGANVDYWLLRNLKLSVGYLGLRDKVELIDGSKTTVHGDLALFKGFWLIRPGLDLTLRATTLDSDFRDAMALGSYRNSDLDINVSAYYKVQFIERDAEPITTDPFTYVIGPYQPYQQGGFTAYKGFGKYVGVEGGAIFRGLLDKGDESTYNHSFDRYMASVYLYKLPLKGSRWVFGFDSWSTPHTLQTYTFRGEFQQVFMKRGRLVAGTAYDLYKVDNFTGQEQDDVRTYYVGVTVPVGKHLYAKARYSFEKGTLRDEDYLQVRLGYEF